MADIGGNFVNPAYASPQQIAQLRQLASHLMGQATTPDATHWTGILAKALMGYSGRKEMEKADVQEQTANKEFAKEILQATSSKDPSQIMAVMANPRAAPLQALLIGKLLEWGPEQGVTLPGLAAHGPAEPWFNKGATSGATPPVAPAQGSTAPITPTPVQTTTESAPDMSSVGDVVPGSRTVTGTPDAVFDQLGQKYGIPNLGQLNKVGMQQAGELEAQKTGAALRGAQTQTAAAQGEVSTPIRQRIPEEIKSIKQQLEGETFYSPLTGKAGHVRAQIPGTPAFNLNLKLETVKDLATQLYADQLRATNPTARIMPAQLEMYRQSLGLDLRDPATLKRSLDDLMKRYGGGTGYTPTPQPAPQGPFPAQAGESGGGGYKVLKVTPYGGQ